MSVPSHRLSPPFLDLRRVGQWFPWKWHYLGPAVSNSDHVLQYWFVAIIFLIGMLLNAIVIGSASIAVMNYDAMASQLTVCASASKSMRIRCDKWHCRSAWNTSRISCIKKKCPQSSEMQSSLTFSNYSHLDFFFVLSCLPEYTISKRDPTYSISIRNK